MSSSATVATTASRTNRWRHGLSTQDIGGTVGQAALKAAAAGEKDPYGQELMQVLQGEIDKNCQ